MIYVFLADGFEEIEALTTVDLMRRAELPVQTVGIGGKRIIGSHQIEVTADIKEDAMSMEDLEMVVLPGGLPGTVNLDQSESVRKAVSYCYENGRYVAAICAAPSVLGHMGILRGRRATCSASFQDELLGADYTDELVTVDDKIITGNGPSAAIPFTLQLVDLLAEKETAERLRKTMQCQ